MAKEASNAGQLKAEPSLDAMLNISTETPILPNSHNMKLTAETLGDRLESRLVIPRAIKALGTTAQAAPYNADHPIS
jgi:hypothetical protein